MKNTVWNSEDKNVIIFSSDVEALEHVKKNNKLGKNGRYILQLTTTDICSNCGGSLNSSGWCANYCMGDV